MGKRTKKLLITLSCVSLFASGSLLQEFINHKFVNKVIQQTNEQVASMKFDQLNTQLQMCVMSANGKVFQYLHTNDPRDAAIVDLTIEKCNEWLDTLGKNAPDKKTSILLGEARLFFGGFREAAHNIILRQSQLAELYGEDLTSLANIEYLVKIKKLEEEQHKAIPDFNKFTGKIFLSILQAGPFNIKVNK